MKILSLKIIDVVLDVLKKESIEILADIDHFEELINSYDVTLYEECYLIIIGVKCGLFNVLMFNKHVPVNEHVTMLRTHHHLSENEALFTVKCIQNIIDKYSLIVEVMNIYDLENQSRQENNLKQLKLIAMSYFEGIGIPQDFLKAYDLFKYCYDAGSEDCCYYIGYMLEEGLGVEKSLSQAIDYYYEGSKIHDPKCLYKMGLLYLSRDGEDNKEMALEYLNDSKENEAYLTLGLYYEKKECMYDAYSYYLKGAYGYEKDCLYKVGTMYLNGIGVIKDHQEAMKYLTYSSYCLNANAFFDLAMIYLEGKDENLNQDLGLSYLDQAVKYHSKAACIQYAYLYESGIYVKKDNQKAIQYYQLAIDISNQDIKKIDEKIEELRNEIV